MFRPNHEIIIIRCSTCGHKLAEIEYRPAIEAIACSRCGSTTTAFIRSDGYPYPVWISTLSLQELQGNNLIGTISVLFLAADPSNASHLRLSEEYREIDEQLALAKQRDYINLALPQLSLRPKDIARALLNVEPRIVHFSGHGTSDGSLCFENEIGQTHLVQPDALAALFEQFAHQVDCVLLNACYSEIQARAIVEHINHVIGMSKAIGDKAAIAFSIGFYQALGAGRTIEEAFRFGCVQIRLQDIPEHLTPVLIKKGTAQS